MKAFRRVAALHGLLMLLVAAGTMRADAAGSGVDAAGPPGTVVFLETPVSLPAVITSQTPPPRPDPAAGLPKVFPDPAATPRQSSPGEACRVAILGAASRYGIPPELMMAISLVESGRTDPATGTRMPWPWTANAGGQDYRFETSAEAAAWVRRQQARGTVSIDTGCMQVNLPFDPEVNADYAARFLQALRVGPAGGDWLRAVGYYHSQTRERADWYRGLVESARRNGLPDLTVPPSGPAAADGAPDLSNQWVQFISPAGGEPDQATGPRPTLPVVLDNRMPPSPVVVIRPQ